MVKVGLSWPKFNFSPPKFMTKVKPIQTTQAAPASGFRVLRKSPITVKMPKPSGEIPAPAQNLINKAKAVNSKPSGKNKFFDDTANTTPINYSKPEPLSNYNQITKKIKTPEPVQNNTNATSVKPKMGLGKKILIGGAAVGGGALLYNSLNKNE